MGNIKNDRIYQFKITLLEIEPIIWRRIQVPEKYTFWDLHVAIQSAMGWLDYHLHEFRIKPKHKRKPIEIGIPDDDWGRETVKPGWEMPIVDFFHLPGMSCEYEYDFGDGWQHEIMLEGIFLKDKGERYPKCVAGERACPPEDCGGSYGYYEMLEILKDPNHKEYKGYMEWLKGHAMNYLPYDPEAFSPESVLFANPKQRLKTILQQQ